ncbi:hypothetical protein LTR99_000872 [Exophiala xenobiotica]|uniref:Uncharacterized protein n=1 Tax=Vermiconidia calcicola TaxID=1690605 RepID=A0AAV9QMS5_9PEZI|nr:hypothetical protein LTR96_000473 [Exophiala xenobiotica]KAK5530691.1 hypothetical protein LTR23_010216 [Chaetothyriales sp. CCFEE 6169]KAK5545435.1 hypothetical protein LTR25_000442 [Vermiconidia calcicola]KAK5307900.1 hypothetical protein LTR99_000872 [Exophiala xenobiotica]KAK5343203.1 hypothetical protein LTR98_000832 [Exophiala xenobiotica]
MCGDSHLPPAPESGDLVAVIHAHAHSQSQSAFRGRLRLSNRTPGATTSSFECAEDSNVCDDDRRGSSSLNVRIHKYGQPLSMSPTTNHWSDSDSDSESEAAAAAAACSSNPILHSFFVDTVTTSKTGDVRLNLGVGGDGVVGRTVSIFDGRSKRIVGQGIIGWI